MCDRVAAANSIFLARVSSVWICTLSRRQFNFIVASAAANIGRWFIDYHKRLHTHPFAHSRVNKAARKIIFFRRREIRFQSICSRANQERDSLNHISVYYGECETELLIFNGISSSSCQVKKYLKIKNALLDF